MSKKIKLVEQTYLNVSKENIVSPTDSEKFIESIDGKDLKCRGILHSIPISKYTENFNNRIYPKALWENIAKKKVAEGSLSLADHPSDNSEGSVKDICAVWKNMKVNEDSVTADCYFVGDYGQTLFEAVQNGAKAGVSSSGYGELQEDGKTVNPNTFDLERLGDFVLSPSQGTFATSENIVTEESMHPTNLNSIKEEFTNNIEQSKAIIKENTITENNDKREIITMDKFTEANYWNNLEVILREAKKNENFKEAMGSLTLAKEKAPEGLEEARVKIDNAIQTIQEKQEAQINVALTENKELKDKYEVATKTIEEMKEQLEKATKLIKGDKVSNFEGRGLKESKDVLLMKEDIERFKEDREIMMSDIERFKEERGEFSYDIKMFEKKQAFMSEKIKHYASKLKEAEGIIAKMTEMYDFEEEDFVDYEMSEFDMYDDEDDMYYEAKKAKKKESDDNDEDDMGEEEEEIEIDEKKKGKKKEASKSKKKEEEEPEDVEEGKEKKAPKKKESDDEDEDDKEEVKESILSYYGNMVKIFPAVKDMKEDIINTDSLYDAMKLVEAVKSSSTKKDFIELDESTSKRFGLKEEKQEYKFTF